MRALKLKLLILVGLVLVCTNGRASLVYVYDFPGPGPNNGQASNQTNPQPSHGTMSDFTRNGGITGSGVNGVFGGQNWPSGAAPDPNRWMGFTITANPGFVLNLTQLTFDSLKNGSTGGAGGAFTGEVALFLNGSTTAYATFLYVPNNAPMTSYVFDFADVTYADMVTTATFKFFAYNATPTIELQVDNVSLFGGIDVPEAASLGPIALLIGCALTRQLALRRRESNKGSDQVT